MEAREPWGEEFIVAQRDKGWGRVEAGGWGTGLETDVPVEQEEQEGKRG